MGAAKRRGSFEERRRQAEIRLKKEDEERQAMREQIIKETFKEVNQREMTPEEYAEYRRRDARESQRARTMLATMMGFAAAMGNFSPRYR